MSKPSKRKKFSVQKSPRLTEAVKNLAEEFVRAKKAQDDEASLLAGFVQLENIRQAELKEHREMYPADPPNAACGHALLNGVLLDNAFGARVQEWQPLFTTPMEEMFVWTPREHEYSNIVIAVNGEVHQQNVWKTVAHVLKHCEALDTSFESLIDPSYCWIYRFDPKKRWEEVEFMDDEVSPSGVVQKLHFFTRNAQMIELQYSDDTFFYALQNLVTNFEHHWFCLECERLPEEERHHPNHEPHIWEYSMYIPKMESAIVHATKAVEGILGQQGKDKEKARGRWKESLDINPDDQFLDTGKTYFEYHEHLIEEIRNKVAHNLRKKPFMASRAMTIQTQLYAWEIVRDYYHKFRKTEESAIAILNMNTSLIAQEPLDFGTSRTKE